MLNIAIDGHVASGKSSVAKGIAKKLGIKVLDTGAIYRGLACAYKEMGLGDVSLPNIELFIERVNVSVVFQEDGQHVIINGKDYTSFLRLEETSSLSSQISPFPILREKVMLIQREFAKANDCVMEGRDIGTDVLPNADVKFFVTASEEVRAARRFAQVKESGSVTFQQVLADLKARDYKDENRKVAPLRPAKDSIIIDSGEMTLEETIEKCIDLIKQRMNDRAKSL